MTKNDYEQISRIIFEVFGSEENISPQTISNMFKLIGKLAATEITKEAINKGDKLHDYAFELAKNIRFPYHAEFSIGEGEYSYAITESPEDEGDAQKIILETYSLHEFIEKLKEYQR